MIWESKTAPFLETSSYNQLSALGPHEDNCVQDAMNHTSILDPAINIGAKDGWKNAVTRLIQNLMLGNETRNPSQGQGKSSINEAGGPSSTVAVQGSLSSTVAAPRSPPSDENRSDAPLPQTTSPVVPRLLVNRAVTRPAARADLNRENNNDPTLTSLGGSTSHSRGRIHRCCSQQRKPSSHTHGVCSNDRQP